MIAVDYLLQAEAASARIEGILLGDKALGRAWRNEMAFMEVAASIGLEDIRLPTGAIVLRLVDNSLSSLDMRATGMAVAMLGVLKRPPPLVADPAGAVRLIEMASSSPGQVTDPADRLDDAEMIEMVSRAGEHAATPVLAALRLASEYAHRGRAASPATERLLFSVAEHAFRRRGSGAAPAGPAGRGDAEPVFTPAVAAWTLAPSLALTQAGFHLWAPLQRPDIILKHLAAQAARELGHLGRLRHQIGQARTIADAAESRSRMPDLVALLEERQILNSAMVMKEIGVTRKTALSLLDQLTGVGILREVTQRRAARLWATASLADRLAIERTKPRMGAKMAAHAPSSDGGLRPTQAVKAFDDGGLNRAFDALDAALAGVDALVRRPPSAGNG